MPVEIDRAAQVAAQVLVLPEDPRRVARDVQQRAAVLPRRRNEELLVEERGVGRVSVELGLPRMSLKLLPARGIDDVEVPRAEDRDAVGPLALEEDRGRVAARALGACPDLL